MKIIFMGALLFAGSVSAQDIEVYELAEGFSAPFPSEPEFVGNMEQGETEYRGYRNSSTTDPFGVTAAVFVSDPLEGEYDIRELLEVRLVVESKQVGSEPLSMKHVSVDGRPAVIGHIPMDHPTHEAMSHTAVVYDEGRLHLWSVQDPVETSNGRGREFFDQGLDEIRID